MLHFNERNGECKKFCIVHLSHVLAVNMVHLIKVEPRGGCVDAAKIKGTHRAIAEINILIPNRPAEL